MRIFLFLILLNKNFSKGFCMESLKNYDISRINVVFQCKNSSKMSFTLKTFDFYILII